MANRESTSAPPRREAPWNFGLVIAGNYLKVTVSTAGIQGFSITTSEEIGRESKILVVDTAGLSSFVFSTPAKVNLGCTLNPFGLKFIRGECRSPDYQITTAGQKIYCTIASACFGGREAMSKTLARLTDGKFDFPKSMVQQGGGKPSDLRKKSEKPKKPKKEPKSEARPSEVVPKKVSEDTKLDPQPGRSEDGVFFGDEPKEHSAVATALSVLNLVSSNSISGDGEEVNDESFSWDIHVAEETLRREKEVPDNTMKKDKAIKDKGKKGRSNWSKRASEKLKPFTSLIPEGFQYPSVLRPPIDAERDSSLPTVSSTPCYGIRLGDLVLDVAIDAPVGSETVAVSTGGEIRHLLVRVPKMA